MLSKRIAPGVPALLATLLIGAAGLAGCATETERGDYEADEVISEEGAIPEPGAGVFEDDLEPGFDDGVYGDDFGAGFGNDAYDNENIGPDLGTGLHDDDL